ncbi:MAG: hypothetical protein QM757_44095 [Paludibaculum sp.]
MVTEKDITRHPTYRARVAKIDPKLPRFTQRRLVEQIREDVERLLSIPLSQNAAAAKANATVSIEGDQEEGHEVKRNYAFEKRVEPLLPADKQGSIAKRKRMEKERAALRSPADVSRLIPDLPARPKVTKYVDRRGA